MYKNRKVVVEEVKGGWLLTWTAELRSDCGPAKDKYNYPLGLGNRPDTNGKEIYTSKKELMKRLKAFL